MSLAIDIGNTNIVLGIFKGKRLFKKFRINTALRGSEIHREIKESFRISGIDAKSLKSATISSVVPEASKVVVDTLKKRFSIKSLLLGKDIKVPIRNLYRRPVQVGQDRLVNAYACLYYYGRPAIIVDFGTATTFDYLDEDGAYSGGLITPGVEISLEALAERAALLPKIELKRPKRLIGKDTVESMRSGVVYGLAGLCDGIIRRIKKESGRRIITVATGGLAPFFSPYCRQIDHIDTNLTLKGLHRLGTG